MLCFDSRDVDQGVCRFVVDQTSRYVESKFAEVDSAEVVWRMVFFTQEGTGLQTALACPPHATGLDVF